MFDNFARVSKTLENLNESKVQNTSEVFLTFVAYIQIQRRLSSRKEKEGKINPKNLGCAFSNVIFQVKPSYCSMTWNINSKFVTKEREKEISRVALMWIISKNKYDSNQNLCIQIIVSCSGNSYKWALICFYTFFRRLRLLDWLKIMALNHPTMSTTATKNIDIMIMQQLKTDCVVCWMNNEKINFLQQTFICIKRSLIFY